MTQTLQSARQGVIPVTLIPVLRQKKVGLRIPVPPRQEEPEMARLRAKYAGTTPQGREIIRKKLFTLKRQLMAADQNGAGISIHSFGELTGRSTSTPTSWRPSR